MTPSNKTMTPPNGYYIARVQYDTGGTLPTYVHVHDGVIRANDGNELRAEACSEFAEIGTLSYCGVWPDRAAKELDAARVRIQHLEAALCAVRDAMPAIHEGGGLFWPRHDGDGNYIGEENVSEMSVIQNMVTIATDALHTK